LGQTSHNGSIKLTQAERRRQVIELRREGLSIDRIAERIGFSHQTVRNDLRFYLKKLDQENLQAAAALRAEEFSALQRASALIETEVFERKELDRIADLVKLSEQKRKIYALDIQPVRKAEIQHKKSVVIELITTLKSRISPFAYAEVLGALANDDSYKLMGQLVTDGSEIGIGPSRGLLEGGRVAQGFGYSPQVSWQGVEPNGDPLPVVDP
jgi:DNA-binding CsgD family transcriptional regulator